MKNNENVQRHENEIVVYQPNETVRLEVVVLNNIAGVSCSVSHEVFEIS